MKEATAEETAIALCVIAARGGRVLSAKRSAPHGTSCHDCIHARSHFHTHHILCAKPCATVTGDPHGIEMGWFMYPFEFDPVWRTNPCANYEAENAVSGAVSDAISQAEQ